MKIIALANFERRCCLVKLARELEQAHWQVLMKIMKS